MTSNEFEKLSGAIKRAPLNSIFIAAGGEGYAKVVRDLAEGVNRCDIRVHVREAMLHEDVFVGTDKYCVVDPTIDNLTHNELQFIAKATAHNDMLMRDAFMNDPFEDEEAEVAIKSINGLVLATLGVIIVAFTVYLLF